MRTLPLAIALALLCLPWPADAQTAKAYRISGIKAMLFYEATGTFSKDILADPNISLWNTIIGEGDSGGASSATLVMVEIAGRPGDYASGRKLQITATYRPNGKAKAPSTFARTSGIGILNDRGKVYGPMWLYDTGCSHVQLSARLLGQPQATPMRKTIKFECGE